MKAQPKIEDAAAPPLTKPNPNSPVLKVTGRDSIVVKAGTGFGGYTFKVDTPIAMPKTGLEVGADYAVFFVMSGDGPSAVKLIGAPEGDMHLGGFHFAPGGNAPARAGGDDIPAINPRSLWDLKFRPSSDPRGMALVDRFSVKFWADIYLLGAEHHINGTSKLGVIIADGNDPPVNPETRKKFARLDYETALAVMRHHGKGLMSYDEFRAFAFGVTEKTARDKDPKITGLDMARTSQDGGMQSAGNLWAWGNDGDPDEPRASMFGGSWFSGGSAGSRYADVACGWPDSSDGDLGARGRSDHLQLA
jgi:hypothetical protein